MSKEKLNMANEKELSVLSLYVYEADPRNTPLLPTGWFEITRAPAARPASPTPSSRARVAKSSSPTRAQTTSGLATC